MPSASAVKLWSKTVLVVYLLVLLWLILFKFSSDIFSVLAHHQATSFNLIPFAGNHLREMFDNFVFFIPLGVLLGMNYKTVRLKQKLAFVFLVSLSAEALQFMLAIGAADITDVIMNTCGGLAGLTLYDVAHRRKYLKSDRLDVIFDVAITVLIAVLLVVFFLLRIFVLRVKY